MRGHAPIDRIDSRGCRGLWKNFHASGDGDGERGDQLRHSDPGMMEPLACRASTASTAIRHIHHPTRDKFMTRTLVTADSKDGEMGSILGSSLPQVNGRDCDSSFCPRNRISSIDRSFDSTKDVTTSRRWLDSISSFSQKRIGRFACAVVLSQLYILKIHVIWSVSLFLLSRTYSAPNAYTTPGSTHTFTYTWPSTPLHLPPPRPTSQTSTAYTHHPTPTD